jgi:hypoxanthine phosphoribosyltransferase
MQNDILKVLFSEEDLRKIISDLAKKIEKDYEGKKPLLVGLLSGCLPFMSDLVRYLDMPLYVDYLKVSSYVGNHSTGVITINQNSELDVLDKDVIIIDDIIDTGLTLKNMIAYFLERGAKSVKTCVLLDKPEGRTCDIEADYVGTLVPKEFVVGYGLDYDGLYRNVPFIGVLKPEVYKK